DDPPPAVRRRAARRRRVAGNDPPVDRPRGPRRHPVGHRPGPDESEYMTPYAAVPLPWLGFIVALALLVEQIVLHGFVPATTMLAAFFQVGVLALLCAMLPLIILPPRRVAYLLGFLVCAGLMGWALWLQFGLDLEPCPLCMFQRVALCLAGLVFLVAFIKNPRRGGAVFTAFMTLVFAGAGAALAARQVWLQTLPKDLVPSCGMGISY